ncbi:hypothetical protein C0V97_17230, partial [Asaia sp. W19]
MSGTRIAPSYRNSAPANTILVIPLNCAAGALSLGFRVSVVLEDDVAPDLTWHALIALAQVVMIDITLAGDNAVVIGMVVRGLPATQRRKAIIVGVASAALMRIVLALVASQLLAVIGLTLAGGVLLLWVCWKMYQEMRHPEEVEGSTQNGTLGQAIFRIILADLSMSLDNVLAVAGAS